VAFVKKVVDFLLVDLEVAAVYRELFLLKIALLLNHFKQKSNRSRYNSFVFTAALIKHCLRGLSVKWLILVTFHSICLSTTCLAICKDCCVIAVGNVLYNLMHTGLFENSSLGALLVHYDVKLCVLVGICSLIISTDSLRSAIDEELFKSVVLHLSVNWRSATNCHSDVGCLLVGFLILHLKLL